MQKIDLFGTRSYLVHDEDMSARRMVIAGTAGAVVVLTVILLLIGRDTANELSLIVETVAAVAGVGVAIVAALPAASLRRGASVPTAASGQPGTMDGQKGSPHSQGVSEHAPTSPQLEFVGRHDMLAELLNDLRDSAKPLITLIGMGGIGKTALAEEAVRRLTREEFFDHAVWVSTQAEKFTGEKVKQVEFADYTFDALLSDILSQCDMASSAGTPHAATLQAVKQLLSAKRVLIVLDNLETVADRDALADELFQILGKGKILVTSRYQIHHQHATSIHLEGLSQADGLEFLTTLAKTQHNQNLLRASRQTLVRVHQATGGAPLAMMLVAGQMSYQPVDHVLRTVEKAGASELSYEFYSFIFKKSWSELNDNCRKVLMGMRQFEGNPTADALSYTVNMSEDIFYAAATIVVQRSLLNVVVGVREARYSLHPLTRYFINADIAASWQ
jgi:hypothetical protein